MNTLLTDDERPKLPEPRVPMDNHQSTWDKYSSAQMEAYADAREAAVLAKLAQQADRQRVPEGWKLVPVEPTWEMLEAALDCAAKPSHREAYAAMLAAAPEAPAQASAVDDDYKGWYCAQCQRGVDAREVTSHEQHEACGRFIAHDRPPKVEASAVDERAAGVFSEVNACMHRETCRAALAQKGGAA
jgi:hypothetical protein